MAARLSAPGFFISYTRAKLHRALCTCCSSLPGRGLHGLTRDLLPAAHLICLLFPRGGIISHLTSSRRIAVACEVVVIRFASPVLAATSRRPSLLPAPKRRRRLVEMGSHGLSAACWCYPPPRCFQLGGLKYGRMPATAVDARICYKRLRSAKADMFLFLLLSFLSPQPSIWAATPWLLQSWWRICPFACFHDVVPRREGGGRRVSASLTGRDVYSTLLYSS